MFRGFWENLEDPIIGLAPMDGVTDAPYRYIVAKHSSPSLVMTEFTNVEGLARGAVKMLTAFLYDEIERPVVAQIYGVEVESYYKCSVMLCYLGFDGIDINMGCPANKVAKKGSGAGLIRTPDLAKEIVRSCKKAVEDWANGISLEDAGVHPDIILAVRKIREKDGVSKDKVERRRIPVSVKTRIGFDKDIAEEWTKHLIEVEPANISMHGRTLKQMYSGGADWEAIARAGALTKGTPISFLGNGDVHSMEMALQKIKEYEVDGVLVGRATFGNPWFFGGSEPTVKNKFEAALEHCRYLEGFNEKWDNFGVGLKFENVDPEEVRFKIPFYALRKHLAWYCKGFEGAKEVRLGMMQANNSEDVREAMRGIFVEG